ncbi:MAG TPA: DUF2267 domain-containing protein [Anaeromyxobacteraceae bacterium]
MTVPQDVTYASQQLQEWLLDLKQRALLGSTNGSYAMLRAVLHEARDRLLIDDALRFADALPPLVRGIMLESWHPLDAIPSTRPPVLDAVKARLEPHHPPPESIVEDVLAVLAHRTHPHLLHAIAEHLPPEFQSQWRAATDVPSP